MSATLYFNGIRISVPTEELGEALRQISTLAAPLAQTTPAPRPQAGPSLDIFAVSAQHNNELETTRVFLQVIADHERTGGADVSTVMRVLGAAHAKGVGSKAAVVNRVLDSRGFAIPDVYTNDRDALGMRYWKAGPKLADALATFEPGYGQDPDDDE